MTARKQELKNSIEDLRDELSKFESELEEMEGNTIKIGDIVRIISKSPIVFTTDSPFIVGAYCKVCKFSDYEEDRIVIKLHEDVYHDTNVCKKSQVEVVWSS